MLEPNPTTATITLRQVEVHDQFTNFDLNYDNAEAAKKAQENLFRNIAKAMSLVLKFIFQIAPLS